MQITKETVEVLKNFSLINPSIVIREGNQLVTHSVDRGGVIATATINEHFPKTFGIYELNKFLNSLTLVDDYEIGFGESQMIIKNKSRRIKYTYTNPAMLAFNLAVNPPELNYAVSFPVVGRDLVTLRKAAGTLNLDTIRIVGANGKIYIKTGSKDSKDEYSVDTGVVTEHDFMFVYPVSRFSVLMTQDYEVSVTPVGFARFKNDRVTYWIAPLPTKEAYQGTLSA